MTIAIENLLICKFSKKIERNKLISQFLNRRGWAGQAQEVNFSETVDYPMPLPGCIKITTNLSNLMDNITKLQFAMNCPLLMPEAG